MRLPDFIGLSSNWIGHSAPNTEIPVRLWEGRPKKVRESVTQLAEYLPLTQEVVGSLPTGLTKLFRDSQVGKAPDCYSGHSQVRILLPEPF